MTALGSVLPVFVLLFPLCSGVIITGKYFSGYLYFTALALIGEWGLPRFYHIVLTFVTKDTTNSIYFSLLLLTDIFAVKSFVMLSFYFFKNTRITNTCSDETVISLVLEGLLSVFFLNAKLQHEPCEVACKVAVWICLSLLTK